MPITLIAAIGKETRALGKNNDLIFHIPEDLKHFKEQTKGHTVIMGRKTWDSLPPQFRPLPGRKNIIITRSPDFKAEGATIVSSVQDALTEAAGDAYVIGGGEIYKETLPFADVLDLTLVESDAEGDVFFPPYEKSFTCVKEGERQTSKDGTVFQFTLWTTSDSV